MESPYLEYLNDKFRFPRSLVHRPIQRFFQRHLEAAPAGARVLDAGCGNGIETGPYAGRLRVTGIDYQTDYLRYCARTYAAARYARADVTRLPFASASFDLIVMNQVIEHLRSPEGAVAELARVLAPGGRLLVSTPNYGGIGWPLVERTYHRWFASEFDAEENHVTAYRPDSLRRELSAALVAEHVGTVCAGLILVAVARRDGSRRGL